MFVIATHNGKKVLTNLLSDLSRFNISNENICIVDNLSTSKDSLDYLERLKKENYKVLHNPESTYEIGAYLYALKNFKSDVWFLMQDCNRFRYDFFSEITPKLTSNNVYCLLTFPTGMYDAPYDKMILSLHFGSWQYSKGTYGCTMFALDEVIQKVKNDWIIPRSKLDGAAAERTLSVIFDKHNIEIVGMGDYNSTRSSDPDPLTGYPHFYHIHSGRV